MKWLQQQHGQQQHGQRQLQRQRQHQLLTTGAAVLGCILGTQNRGSNYNYF